MCYERSIKRALVSVSDKTGLADFCRQLEKFGVEIISTGGTSQWLRNHNFAVVEISEITGYPELMGGRVKTLHPKIHAALLARDEDCEVLSEYEIESIDLLVVNLYPFAETVSNKNCSLESAIENIDIGGPAMLRAAAKNYQRVTVVSDYQDYPLIITEMTENQGCVTEATRFNLSQKVFKLTAQYDSVISSYLGTIGSDNSNLEFSPVLKIELHKKADLRYGENPHQRGALYVEPGRKNDGVAHARQIQGKDLSFNNLADADAALECVKSFRDIDACVIVKHANPCGVACSSTQLNAYEKAFATDPVSAFGGIIAFNKPLQCETARKIVANQFVEVVIAPYITSDVAAVFEQKPSIRVLSCNDWQSRPEGLLDIKRIAGGLLIQDVDNFNYDPNKFQCVTKIKPSNEQWVDLQFAWSVVRFVKSNAIVYAKNQQTLGIGAGQMSRIDSTKIAAEKAKEANLKIQGSVMASDAFFPFRDAIDAAARMGITAIIQPGGSIRDREIIAAADEANIVMVFTGVRHFRH